MLRSGAHWKDLPAEYGNWKSAHQHFTRWAKAGRWGKIFQVILENSDSIDTTILWVHQQEGRGGGGARTRLWGVTGAGLAPRFSWWPTPRVGPCALPSLEARERIPRAIPLLSGIETDCVIADKGYKSNKILASIRSERSVAVILAKANRRDPWIHHRELYGGRNLIERAFNKLMHWRGIASRYDRRSLYSLSTLYLVASVGWRKQLSILPSAFRGPSGALMSWRLSMGLAAFFIGAPTSAAFGRQMQLGGPPPRLVCPSRGVVWPMIVHMAPSSRSRVANRPFITSQPGPWPRT